MERHVPLCREVRARPARLEGRTARGGDGPDLRRHLRGSDPYFHPYYWVVRGDMSRTRRHRNRTSEDCGTLGGRPCQTTQIYEGTNQIQRMVIARKTFTGGR